MPPRLTLRICQEEAKKRGGKCLSKTYTNQKQKLLWECDEGHQWRTSINNIKNHNQWCPYCYGNVNYSIELCHEIAAKNEGKCLSTEYKNNKSYLHWECKEGHQWYACFSSLLAQDSWCPICANNIKMTLEECQEVAVGRGGKCLSEEYINRETPMLWECKEGHQWKARFRDIKRRCDWCPYCSSCRSEKIARETLEALMDKPFPKCRPTWLGGLELDGYCEEEKLAMEYQGQQHYEFIPFFHRTKTAFQEQLTRDTRKKEILKERGIDLLEIPYTYSYLNEKELDDYIERELQFILARRGEYTESDQIKILGVKDKNIEYFDKSIKETCCRRVE